MLSKGDRFAGANPTYPNPGDTVLILEGDSVGAKVTVVQVCGCAFNHVYRVHVRGVNGEGVWYWPWNLQIVTEEQ